jgi:hypothetical protein
MLTEADLLEGVCEQFNQLGENGAVLIGDNLGDIYVLHMTNTD